MIIAVCGHTLEDIKDGAELTIKEYTGDLKKCLCYGLYCQECAAFYRRKGYALEDKKAEEEWLMT